MAETCKVAVRRRIACRSRAIRAGVRRTERVVACEESAMNKHQLNSEQASPPGNNSRWRNGNGAALEGSGPEIDHREEPKGGRPAPLNRRLSTAMR